MTYLSDSTLTAETFRCIVTIRADFQQGMESVS